MDFANLGTGPPGPRGPARPRPRPLVRRRALCLGPLGGAAGRAGEGGAHGALRRRGRHCRQRRPERRLGPPRLRQRLVRRRGPFANRGRIDIGSSHLEFDDRLHV